MDKNLVMGVMIGLLFGNRDFQPVADSIGKKITRIEIVDNNLLFEFEDNSGFKLRDDGQSCCENRYMHTDDELSYYEQSILQNIELRDGPSEEGEYEYQKESQFLIVTTSKGSFTVVNYNEHNGYYGGFLLNCERIDMADNTEGTTQ